MLRIALDERGRISHHAVAQSQQLRKIARRRLGDRALPGGLAPTDWTPPLKASCEGLLRLSSPDAATMVRKLLSGRTALRRALGHHDQPPYHHADRPADVRRHSVSADPPRLYPGLSTARDAVN